MRLPSASSGCKGVSLVSALTGSRDTRRDIVSFAPISDCRRGGDLRGHGGHLIVARAHRARYTEGTEGLLSTRYPHLVGTCASVPMLNYALEWLYRQRG